MIKITKKVSYSTSFTINNNIKQLKNSKGFTLIELMITVAIVGILAAVALPAYQDYVARSQVSEGLVLVSGAKPVIAEYYSNHGAYPTSSDIGFNGYVGSYIGSTTIGDDGQIIATFSNDAHRQLRGQRVTLTPEEDTNTGNLKWSCGSSVDSKFLPTSCVNDGSTGNPSNPGNGETDPDEGGGGTDPDEGGGGTEPTDPTDPGPITPDYPTITTSYVDGRITYNGDGILNYDSFPITGTMIDGKIVFNIPNTTHTLAIDENGNLIGNNDMGSYSMDFIYLNGGSEKYVEVANFNFDGVPFKAISPDRSFDNPVFQTNGVLDYQKYSVAGDIIFYMNKLTDVANNNPNSGTAQEAMAGYRNAAQAYANLINQHVASGGQIADTDRYYLNNFLN